MSKNLYVMPIADNYLRRSLEDTPLYSQLFLAVLLEEGPSGGQVKPLDLAATCFVFPAN